MSLWKKTDAVPSRPNFINLANYPAGTQLVFVDATEAAAASNKKKGIKGAGWYLYREYNDSNGDKRYKTELVVALAETAARAGDAADDLTVPDVNTVITIGTQPTAQTTVAGAATFTVAATIAPAGATLAYQWQVKATPAGRWTDVAGATAATLALTGRTSANNGALYRVVVSGGGAKAVTSSTALLTFGT